MRLFIILLLVCSTAQAEDIPVYLIDTEELDQAAEKTRLVDVVKAHFGETLNLAASQRLYCSKTKINTCTLAEAGTCTKAQFATMYRTGIKLAVLAIDGITVAYRRDWAPVEITAGARQDAVIAYLLEAHPDITLSFMVDFAVARDTDAKIQSRAAYKSVIDDQDIAQHVKDGTLLRLAPQ